MKSVFVGNMSFQTTESELRELFAPYGQIGRVHIAMDRETGRARGFAFIEMPNDEEAAKAISGLDGAAHGGRNLKVNEARPKGESGPPRGGNRSFGNAPGGRPPTGRRLWRRETVAAGEAEAASVFLTKIIRESVRQPREPRW